MSTVGSVRLKIGMQDARPTDVPIGFVSERWGVWMEKGRHPVIRVNLASSSLVRNERRPQIIRAMDRNERAESAPDRGSGIADHRDGKLKEID